MGNEHQTTSSPLHEVSSMGFGENGPEQLDVGCTFVPESGRIIDGAGPGHWLVDITIWEHSDLVDQDNPVQFDAERGEQIPEASWNMTPARARELAAMIIKAAETAELFQSGD
jgi:hypothetical protein